MKIHQNCSKCSAYSFHLNLFSLVSGSPYYDNVRPLSYPDSDAVLICFDISRPETLDSVLKKVCSCQVIHSRGDHGAFDEFSQRSCTLI